MQKVRIGVLVSGGGTNLQALIDEINDKEINGEIIAVVADRKEIYAIERAKNNNIKALIVDRKKYADNVSFNNVLIESLQELNIELVVLAGFLTILNKSFVNTFRNKIINIHPSLIPAFCGKGYYGEKVHKAVIDYGAKVSGATVHFVDEGTDSGPIILQDYVYVDDDETTESLKRKVLNLEHELLPKAVRLYCLGGLIIDGRKVYIGK